MGPILPDIKMRYLSIWESLWMRFDNEFVTARNFTHHKTLLFTKQFQKQQSSAPSSGSPPTTFSPDKSYSVPRKLPKNIVPESPRLNRIENSRVSKNHFLTNSNQTKLPLDTVSANPKNESAKTSPRSTTPKNIGTLFRIGSQLKASDDESRILSTRDKSTKAIVTENSRSTVREKRIAKMDREASEETPPIRPKLTRTSSFKKIAKKIESMSPFAANETQATVAAGQDDSDSEAEDAKSNDFLQRKKKSHTTASLRTDVADPFQ